MQFQVPQFIEIEDKIFGPFTLKQFIYMAGAAGISFVMYEFLPFIVAIPLILAILTFSGALGWWKPNGKPFINVAEAAFKYFFASKLYIWKKVDRRPEVANSKSAGEAALAEAEAGKKYAGIMVPKISDSKLKDLAWSLDIKESLYSNKNQK
jgi:hypothetical protein